MINKFLILFGVICFISCKPNITNEPKTNGNFGLAYNQPKDSALRKELEYMAVEDQTLRLLLPAVKKKFGNGSIEEKYIWSLIHLQDSICLRRIVIILDEYGWLGKTSVGNKANQAIWLVIQHANLETQEKYLPILKESVEKGESEGWHQAFLEDRIQMRNNKKQIYGSQATWDETTGKMKIYPIQNANHVNERRKTIGLEPIEEYAKMNGYVFDQIDD